MKSIITTIKALSRYTISFILVLIGHYSYFVILNRYSNNGYSILQLTIIAGFIFYECCVWLPSIIYEILDRLSSRKQYQFLLKYKLKTEGKEKKFFEMLPNVIQNEIALLLVTVPIFLYGGICHPVNPETFTLAETLKWVAIYGLGYEIVFYIGHRMLHHNRQIYKKIHQQHHSSYGTSGLSHHYMHLLDFTLEVIFPGVIPMIILGAHGPAFVAFLGMGSWNGVCVHSGWDIPLTPNPRHHFMHHYFHHCNFGLGPFDLAMSTFNSGVDVPIKYSSKKN